MIHYSYQQAKLEAERCLYCFDAPCEVACPVHIEIPKFIAMIRSGNILGAAEVTKTANAMIHTCSKVCPEEVFCQSMCTRGKQDTPISIRELHQFATSYEQERGVSKIKLFPRVDKHVAIVGGGPAGLGCAFELSKFGYQVDLYEPAKLGGVPRKNIPTHRLHHSILDADMEFLSNSFRVKKKFVDAKLFTELQEKYDAVFLGVGLGVDRLLGVPGEKLQNVYPVLHFLENAKTQPKKIKLGRSVIVVGGGNVSLDAAATAKRLGAERVLLIYRRSENEMRVWKAELEEARKQGVEIRFLTNPVAIVGTKKVEGLKCRQTKLSKQRDKSGRPIPVDVKGSDFILIADTIIVAIGQSIAADWLEGFDREKGYIKVDGEFRTSRKGFFAGGDMIAGEGTIVQSIAQGKHAAHAIHHYLSTSQSYLE